MDLSVIIVSWNVKDKLRECLKSVQETMRGSDLAYEVFVVDNASRDGSADMVKKEFQDFFVHCCYIYDSKKTLSYVDRPLGIALRRAKGRLKEGVPFPAVTEELKTDMIASTYPLRLQAVKYAQEIVQVLATLQGRDLAHPQTVSSLTAGMEEAPPRALPGQSVQEIVEQQGGMAPGAAQAMAGQLYTNRPEVQQVLRANEGQLKLTAEVAGKLSGRSDALGGLLISGSAADLSVEDFMVIADSDLSNPAAQRVLAWIPGGSDSQHVAKTLGILKAGPRQIALFEEESGLTSERVQALVAKNLAGAVGPRSIVGTQDQVKALPVAAFKVLARMKGLPDVVFLGVAFTFKDQYDQQDSLIVWTQA